jgi:hypothetical protein
MFTRACHLAYPEAGNKVFNKAGLGLPICLFHSVFTTKLSHFILRIFPCYDYSNNFLCACAEVFPSALSFQISLIFVSSNVSSCEMGENTEV